MRTLLFTILVAAAAILQIAGVSIAGITPNFFLIALCIAALGSKDFLSFGIVMIIGLIIIRFQPGMPWQSLVVAGFGAALFLIKRYLPWLEIFTVVFGLATLTILFYLVVDPGFLFKNYPVVFIEMLYNIGIGSALFFIVPRASTRK